ncbi:hypothetical protein NM688_g4306 [Phlebia brevispora]|uniref:Uncharacterized protein n=1 Tax=Phlebia brevispora TaxID=194682 RepID=A0ACC1T3D3_9APHY|nr:hypothetical protein NM688_g4306 [Phlebia brevispora]
MAVGTGQLLACGGFNFSLGLLGGSARCDCISGACTLGLGLLTTTMSPNGIFKLSVEILVEIMSYLRYLDLLRCRQVSRKLSTLVNETPSLRYTLELGLTGYEDGSPSGNLLQRLATLDRIQRSWRDPHPTFSHSVVVPSREWFEARWFKDILVGRIPADIHRLDIFRLSAAVPDGERLQSLHFDVEFDATCVDPGQDLVVLTRSAFGPNNGLDALAPPDSVRFS